MATQFQGPLTDPCVLYKRFWQEPPRPMHKDDLILQACHYQPSRMQLGPSFSPCELFVKPEEEKSKNESMALLLRIC